MSGDTAHLTGGAAGATASAVRDNIAEAMQVAARLGPRGLLVAARAREAFVHAMDVTALAAVGASPSGVDTRTGEPVGVGR